MSKETEFLKNFYKSQDKETSKAALKQQQKEYRKVKHLGKSPKIDKKMPSVINGNTKEDVVNYIVEKFKNPSPMRDPKNNDGLEQE
ncbi:MAG: hypothetical protein WCX32_03430 [Clostridia bacterium]|jgi:hypothetical protein|nr:hypothetical protein [Clostridia bacterium]MDD4275541.1 hypothetical protein [Clostridia bacterium]